MIVGIDARDLTVSLTGMGRYIHDLLDNMAPMDRNIEYILYSHKPILDFPIDEHENVLSQITTGPFGLFAAPRELWKMLWMPFVAKKDKLDLFFAPSNTTPYFINCPVLVTVHDVIYARHPEWGVFKERIIAKRAVKFAHLADAIITPSQKTADDLVELGKTASEKIHVIQHGCNFDFSDAGSKCRKHPLEDNAPYLLFVGFDYPRRDIPGLIEAFSNVKREYQSDYHLIIAGGSKRMDFLQELINKRQIAQHIHILDHIDDPELKNLYLYADAFIYPSIYEGFGFPVLEAMQAGLPVVIPNSGTMPEVAGDAGLYFDPKDPEGMKNAMLKIIQNPELREELSEKSKIQAAKFSWEKAAWQTLELIKKTAKSNR